jgi:hypothetical protein
VRLVADLDDLHVDSNFITAAVNAAFDQIIRAQLAGDLCHILLATLVVHGRGASDHGKVFGREARQRGNNLVGDCIAEVFLCLVAA